MQYAIYQNQCYRINARDGKIRLLSSEKRQGFVNVIVEGVKQDNLFVKEVSEDDLDFAYRTKYLVDYQDQTFEILSGIGKRLLNDDVVILFTDIPAIAKEYGFRHYDNISFQKDIHLGEIDRITEIKIPILRFKGVESTRTIIEKDQIMDYIMNLIE
ncbi:MAG: hypothetical protein AAGU32_10110 [Bacillota bacterium]